MTQIAQLSEAEIEERFHVAGKTAIQFTLAGYARARESFSVHFNLGQDMYLTTLLAVQADKERLIFDCSGSAETNRRFLGSAHCQFVGHPGGIPVQFSCGPASDITYEGSKAFAVALPDKLVRLQRREHFRVETPRLKPLMFFGRLPSGELLKLPSHDISVSGIGLNADSLPESLAVEQVLKNCHFMLPGEAQELFLEATVRRIQERETRTGSRFWQVGLEFNHLSSGDENRIQRYIDRLERERRELL
ncbi:MAG: flagellar brake protein [Rhodocyclales bacterium GT-UBC]|nr:MAG: flagellar brake protein [Rhodocyclales bacterium GT-UBC]